MLEALDNLPPADQCPETSALEIHLGRLVDRLLLSEGTQAVTISPRAQAIRFSLRADDPAEVKARIAAADQYLERILRAFRDDSPTSLTNAQATALAGRLYRAWAGGEGRERTHAVEQGPDGKMHPVPHNPEDDAVVFEAALMRLVRLETIGKHEIDKPKLLRDPFDRSVAAYRSFCRLLSRINSQAGRIRTWNSRAAIRRGGLRLRAFASTHQPSINAVNEPPFSTGCLLIALPPFGATQAGKRSDFGSGL